MGSSNVFGVVKSLLIAKPKKERDAIIRFLFLESNKKRSRKKQRNNPIFWVRLGRTSIWWDNACEQVVVDSEYLRGTNFREFREFRVF